MASKIEYALAIVIGCGSFGIFLGYTGTSVLLANAGGLIISSLFFIVPIISLLILFRKYKSESPPTPKKKYHY